MSTGELPRVAAAVQERVPYLTCATEAPVADGWIPCADLVADPSLVRREIEATLAGRRTDDLQVAASLYAQSYAYRVASLAVAAYACPRLSPASEPPAAVAAAAMPDCHGQAVDMDAALTPLCAAHCQPEPATPTPLSSLDQPMLQAAAPMDRSEMPSTAGM